MTRRPKQRLDERGIALLLTLLLALLVVSLAIGVLLMMTSTTLVTRFHMAESSMSNLAAAGLEQARDTLNGRPDLIPQPNGFVTLEDHVPLSDANDNPIAGLNRSIYAGQTGGGMGESGLYTSVLSVISNSRGPVVIRRADYKQLSFAAFERFYNDWTSGNWYRYDAVFGPVHSNDEIRLSSGGSPRTRFWSKVTSVGSINAADGTFYDGYQTGADRIPFPTSSDITALQPLATASGMLIAGDGRMTADDPELRVEFVGIDLNGDGDTADEDEGYLRVFRTPPSATTEQRRYVTARRWNLTTGAGFPSADNSTDPNLLSPNCGANTSMLDSTWTSVDTIAGITALSLTDRRNAIRGMLTSPTRRCYLGGDRRLFRNQHVTSTLYGSWSTWAGWGGTAPAPLVNAIAAQGVSSSTTASQVALTYWPINRVYNANFRGVIYVTGSVAVSGTVRGRVTLVADGNIMIPDDITYVKSPNTTCADILGLVSRQNIELQDNNVNVPFNVGSSLTALFDDTGDETVHGFLLALGRVGGDDLGGGEPIHPAENCGGDFTSSRGCRFLVGGIAQSDYATSYNGSTGWHDQDHYDRCGNLNPPPYFPTTGTFTKHRYYEIDPVGFDPTTWFNANQ